MMHNIVHFIVQHQFEDACRWARRPGPSDQGGGAALRIIMMPQVARQRAGQWPLLGINRQPLGRGEIRNSVTRCAKGKLMN